MPLPTNTGLATLDYAYLGAPFAQVEAIFINSPDLDTAYLASPFVAVGPSGLNVYGRASGVWFQASKMYVRVSGAWKDVVSVSTRESGVWKS